MLLYFLELFRTVWLAGRPGGGKTSLAVAMALQFVVNQRADKIAVNQPLTVGTLVDTLPAEGVQQLRNVVTILDESWMHLGKGVAAARRDPWLAYRRKYNQYLILPSVLPLTGEVTNFVCERYWNGLALGLPVWVYRYMLKSSETRLIKGKRKPEMGWYFWWHPQRVFPFYDHLSMPGDDYYVYEFG